MGAQPRTGMCQSGSRKMRGNGEGGTHLKLRSPKRTPKGSVSWLPDRRCCHRRPSAGQPLPSRTLVSGAEIETGFIENQKPCVVTKINF